MTETGRGVVDEIAGKRAQERWFDGKTRGLADTIRAYGLWFAMMARAALGGGARGVPQRHLLILATALPPRVTGGVYRPHSWMKHAREHGWRVTGLCLAASGPASEAGRRLRDEIDAEIGIWPARPPNLTPSWRLTPSLDGGIVNVLALFDEGRRRMGAIRPHVVVATGPRFNSFVAALYLARYFRCRLVLDYRDEWSECPFNFVRAGPFDRYMESRCQRAADAIIFTTHSQARHQAEVFRASLEPDKVVVIPNGVNRENDDPRGARDSTDERGAAGEIAFVGTLGDYLMAGPFIDTFQRAIEEFPPADRLAVHFIGTRSPRADAELKSYLPSSAIRVDDLVPLDVAAAMMRRSRALLLLTSPGYERYLPGKLYDYLATDRPILVYGVGGEAARLVDDLGAGRFVEGGDVAALAGAMRAFAVSPRELWNSARRRDWISARGRRALAAEFFRLLEACDERGRRGAP